MAFLNSDHIPQGGTSNPAAPCITDACASASVERRRTMARRLGAWLALASLWLFPCAAWPSAVGTDVLLDSKVTAYKERLISRLQDLLNQRLAPDAWLVELSIAPDTEALRRQAQRANSDAGDIELTTLPKSIPAGEALAALVRSLTPETMPAYLKTVSARITFDNRVDETLIKNLRPAITAALGLKPARGDKLVIRRAALASTDTSNLIEQLKNEKLQQADQVKLLSQAVQGLEIQKKQIEQKELLINTELQRERDEKQRMADDRRALEAQIADLKADLSVYNTPMGDIKKLIKGLELPLTLFPIAVVVACLVLAVVMMSTATKRFQTRRLMGAFEQVAAALSSAGKSSAPSLESLLALTKETKATARDRMAPTQVPSQISAPDRERLSAEAEKANAQLRKNPFTRTLMLKAWLAQGREAEAAAYCSFTPLEDSAAILGSLSADEREAITARLSAEASGEQAAISLFHDTRAYWNTRPPWVAQAQAPGLLALSAAETAARLNQAGPTEAAACIMLLPEDLAAGVLSEMASAPRAAALNQLLSLEEADAGQISSCLQTLQQIFAPQKETRQQVPQQLMIRLLDAGDFEARTTITRILNTNPALAREVRRKVVLIDDLALLDDETLGSVLEAEPPDQLADLFTLLSPELQNRIARVQSPRDLLEMQRAFQQNTSSEARLRKARANATGVERRIRRRLEQMIASGQMPHPADNKAGGGARPPRAG